MIAVTATTCTTAQPEEPLTLDKLQRLMMSMPKPHTFVSSRLFPSDRAMSVEGGSERFTCAHPGFWLKVEHEVRRNQSDSPTVNGILGISQPQVIEIDPWADDSPEAAKWRADHWRRLREAFEVAMTPLPDWLRSPPQFGKHG